MISPRNGRRARAHRGIRGALAAAIAVGAIAAGQLIAPASAVADVQTPDEDAVVELSLTAGIHGVVAPDAPVTATVTIDNGTDAAVAAGRVSVEINKTPLADAAALTAWLDGGDADGAFTSIGVEDSDEVAAAQTASTTISATTTVLGKLPAGVYPIRALLTGPEITESPGATSVLVVTAEKDLQLTVVVPITATPADGSLLSAEELTALTAPDGALTAQLDGVAGTSAAIAIDPLIPTAIRALGSAAPADATSWLARLESLSNERFTLQPGDADATIQARAGLPELLRPLPLSPFIDQANFVDTGEAEGPTPSPTPTELEPEIPTDSELGAVRDAETDILWPLGEARTADLETFDEYLDADITTILPSSSVAAESSALVEVDGHRILVTDAVASAALSEAAATADESDRERTITAGIAGLSLVPHSSLLIGLDRNETRTADALRETILSLSSIGAPTSLSALRSEEPASTTIVGDTTTARADALKDLLADEVRLTSFASILDDPLVLLSPERIEIMRLIGVGTASVFAPGTGAHRTQTTVTLNSVGVQQPSPVQLFTAAAPLPVWVRNDLPWPVNVTLTSTPSDARLDIEPLTAVAAQPASNTRVKVPVSARVGSGVLDVRFSLTSPTGVHIGTDQTAKVTVRAEWEGIGLGILGGLIGLLLILGIVRTIVRRRKDSEADAATEAPAAE
ncbi:DUF6049 family protein [Microbacterium sp. KHB019]|uniref:DUF6049 family protein n=1 Tax=Microbacterium sp. KHB019 TaxID=3129770 RepID=UPI00307A21E1